MITPGAQGRTSAVYTDRLSTTHLRLLRLDPVEAQNRDMPLHVTLEIYELDDCPEYEAISYTWAGEGGDPTQCNPLYVGPYWDVLIQTENCSFMLRDLRPCGNHPFRRLWVDAICINQNDILARDGQVSRMGDIYSNCMRVVVYLPVESPRSFRSIGTGKANRPRNRLTQEVLLHLIHTTRYFNRLWMIQELILPPMVVFHLKDEDWYFSPSRSLLEEGTRADPRYSISFIYPNDSWSEIKEQVESSDTVLKAHQDDLEPAARRQGRRLINHTQHTHQKAVVVTLDLPFWCFYLLRLKILSSHLRILRELNVDVNKIKCEGKPEHRDVYVHELPKQAREELGFVWEHETITTV